MKESAFQRKLILRFEKAGYYVIKLIKTSKNGCPDLLVMKNDTYFFVEVKAKKGVVSELQKYRIEEMKKFGITTFIEVAE